MDTLLRQETPSGSARFSHQAGALLRATSHAPCMDLHLVSVDGDSESAGQSPTRSHAGSVKRLEMLAVARFFLREQSVRLLARDRTVLEPALGKDGHLES